MPGVFSFRTLHDCRDMLAWAEQARHVAIVGGGLLGLEAARGLLDARPDGDRGAPVRPAHERPARHGGRSDAAARGRGHGHRRAARPLDDERRWATGASRASASRTAPSWSATWSCSPPASARTSSSPRRPGWRSSAAIVVDDAMRVLDEDHVWAVGECCQHRGEVYGLVAPLWEQATVLADRITGADPHAEYHGSKLATKLKVSGVELATMGLSEPSNRARRDRPVLRAAARRLQDRDRPRRQARRRHPARRHAQGLLPHAGVRPGHRPTRGAGVAAVRPRRAAGGGERRRAARRGADLQLQRRDARAPSARASRGGSGRCAASWRRRAPGAAAAPARRRSSTSSSGRQAARSRRIPPPTGTSLPSPCASRT